MVSSRVPRIKLLTNPNGSGGMGVYARHLAAGLDEFSDLTVICDEGDPTCYHVGGSVDLVIRHGWSHAGGRTFRTADMCAGLDSDRSRNVFITAFDPTCLWPDKLGHLNDRVDTLWFDSFFMAGRAKRTGLRHKARLVLPPPLAVRPEPRSTTNRYGFDFLHVATGSLAIKGTDIVLSAFDRLVGECHVPAKLLLKVSGRDLDQAHLTRLLREMSSRARAATRVVYGNLSAQKMSELYSRAGWYVHVSRTESLGLPMLEAAACGAGVVTHGWGATGELLEGVQHVVPRGVEERMPANVFRENKETTWFETSVVSLADCMRRAVDEGLENPEKQAATLAQRYGGRAYTRRLKAIVDATLDRATRC